MNKNNSSERSLFADSRAGQIKNGDIADIGGIRVRYQDGAWVPAPVAEPVQPVAAAGYFAPVEEARLSVPDMSDTTIIRTSEERLRELGQARLGAANLQMQLDEGLSRLAQAEIAEQERLAAAQARHDERHSVGAFVNFMSPGAQLFADAVPPAHYETATDASRDGFYPIQPAHAPIGIDAPDKKEFQSKPRRRLPRKLAVVALGGALVIGGGLGVSSLIGAGSQTSHAKDEQPSVDANVAVSAELPLSKTANALTSAFDGCFDDKAQGTGILDAKVTSATPVSWQFSGADKTAMVLVARNGATDNVKPINKQIDATASFAACVVPSEQADVLTIDDASRSIKVNLDKVSPQVRSLMTAGSKMLRGFVTDNNATQAVDVKAVVDALVASKVVDTAEATRLKGAYGDAANVTSESVQASNHTAEAIAKKTDIYAEQVKAAIGAKVLNLINAKLGQLRSQHAIADGPVSVELAGSLSRDITPVGTKPAAATAFTETDPATILNFQLLTDTKN